MRSASTILVCFAVEEEARPLRRRVQAGLPAGVELTIATTGMGRRNTENTLRELLRRRRPAAVFTSGFAGGLNPSLRTGDLLFEAGDSFAWVPALASAGMKPGRFLCHDRVVCRVEEKADLWKATGADAVEMESGIIQAICRGQGIPCATVRVISDAAAEPLPLDFDRLMTPDQTIAYGKLAVELIRSPARIPALVRFRKRLQHSAGVLAAGLYLAIGALGIPGERTE